MYIRFLAKVPIDTPWKLTLDCLANSDVNELVKAGEKIISLLAGNNHPKASEGIETLYVAIVKAMTDSKGNFKTYEKTKFPRVKSSDYMPRINQKVFDLNFGDFRKYKSNI